jgi:hypothetical protein
MIALALAAALSGLVGSLALLHAAIAWGRRLDLQLSSLDEPPCDAPLVDELDVVLAELASARRWAEECG